MSKKRKTPLYLYSSDFSISGLQVAEILLQKNFPCWRKKKRGKDDFFFFKILLYLVLILFVFWKQCSCQICVDIFFWWNRFVWIWDLQSLSLVWLSWRHWLLFLPHFFSFCAATHYTVSLPWFLLLIIHSFPFQFFFGYCFWF